MARRGGTKKRFYVETRGMKVSGGQHVKAGSVLTREGHRWKAGLNVDGLMHLTARCDGEVYFTRKTGKYKKELTYINVRPSVKKEVKK